MEEALGTGAELLVTSCPFCVLNFEDSVKGKGGETEMTVVDMCEVMIGTPQ